jgi:hypothetical protein
MSMTADVGVSLGKLRAMVAPPSGVVARADWADVQLALGVELPADYRRLIDEFGGGHIDDYLYLLEPQCRNPYYDLGEAASERLEALEYLWDRGEERPEELAETGTRVCPWATTDNGEALYWLMKPESRPDDWVVIVNETRGPAWELFDVGCLEFLIGVLSGRITSDILSSLFPSSPHSFASIPALES